MSRESKIMTSTNPQTLVNHYEAFGWELLSLNGSQISMSRETQNPVYPELVKHQAEYEQKAAEYQSITMPDAPHAPEKISIKLCFGLCILLVFPMVIYLSVKFRQKKEYNEKMEAHRREIEARNERKRVLLAELQAIVEESRSIFFSRK